MAGRWAFFRVLLLVLVATPSRAHELRIEPERFELGQTATVVLELEGSFSTVESVPLKMTNLRVVDGPFRSSEFRFVNGRASRRRTFRWIVSAQSPGRATVGPLTLTNESGERATLDLVEAEVSRAPAPLSPDESRELLERLLASGGIFVHPEVDSTDVWVGEQINVTWYLFAEDIRGVQVTVSPDLTGFWAEDLAIDSANPETLRVGDREVRKIPVRRMALFPIEPGTLTIGRLEVIAQILQPIEEPFGIFTLHERRQIEVRRGSREISIEVREVPEGTRIVGSFSLECSPPSMASAGPLSLEVAVEGQGNLRAASPPAFEESLSVPFEVEDLGVSVVQRSGRILMRRRWRYLLFPPTTGNLHIPTLSFPFYDSEVGGPATLKCSPPTVNVTRAVPSAGGSGPTPKGPERSSDPPDGNWTNRILLAVSAILIVIVIVWNARRRRRSGKSVSHRLLEYRNEARDLRSELMRVVRRREIDWDVALHDPGELGDALRSLVSLLDLMEKEPWEVERVQTELARRVKEFESALGAG